MAGTASRPAAPSRRPSQWRLPPPPEPSPEPPATARDGDDDDGDDAGSSASAPSSSPGLDPGGPHDSYYWVPSPGFDASLVLPPPVAALEPGTPLSGLPAPSSSEPSVISSLSSDSSSSLPLPAALGSVRALSQSRSRSRSLSRPPSASPPTWAEDSFATHSWAEQTDVLFPNHHGGVFESSSSMLAADGDQRGRAGAGGHRSLDPEDGATPEQLAQGAGPSGAAPQRAAAAPDGQAPGPGRPGAPRARAEAHATCLDRRACHMRPWTHKISVLAAVAGVLVPMVLHGLWNGRLAAQPAVLGPSSLAAPGRSDPGWEALVEPGVPGAVPVPAPSSARLAALAPAPARHEGRPTCAPRALAPARPHWWTLTSDYWAAPGGRAVRRAAKGAYYVVSRTRAYCGAE